MNGWIWLLLWQLSVLAIVFLGRWIVLRLALATPKDITAILLAAGTALGLLAFVGFNLYAIDQCERYDRCDAAPAWVGEGLHELQRLDRERDAGSPPGGIR